MSDCVFWAFQAHLKYLGIKEVEGSKDIFDALRKPALKPAVTGWYDRTTGDFREEIPWYERVYGGRARNYEYANWTLMYTPGQAVPLILNTLAAYHGLRVVAEWDEFYEAPDWLASMAKTDVQSNLVLTTGHMLGNPVPVEAFTLNPAIYLFLDGIHMNKHAHFFEDRIPYDQGSIVAAFQLQTI